MGIEENSQLMEMLGTLASTLKGYVKDRDRDVTVEFAKLTRQSGLTNPWVFNAIENNLMEVLHRRRGARWTERGLSVIVPVNFGLELVDHGADLRAELEQVKNELADTRQQLDEYSCSFCKAPMTFQGDVPGLACSTANRRGHHRSSVTEGV